MLPRSEDADEFSEDRCEPMPSAVDIPTEFVVDHAASNRQHRSQQQRDPRVGNTSAQPGCSTASDPPAGGHRDTRADHRAATRSAIYSSTTTRTITRQVRREPQAQISSV